MTSVAARKLFGKSVPFEFPEGSTPHLEFAKLPNPNPLGLTIMRDAWLLHSFWKNVVPQESGCWLWAGGRARRGYGQIYDGQRTVRAHRFSYRIHYGEIPRGLWVLHECDNPPCVNPKHLKLGTHDDNMRDMYARGRNNQAKGEQHWKTTLTEEQIRAVYADGRKLKEIAADYGITVGAVSHIKTGKRWSHVTGHTD